MKNFQLCYTLHLKFGLTILAFWCWVVGTVKDQIMNQSAHGNQRHSSTAPQMLWKHQIFRRYQGTELQDLPS